MHIKMNNFELDLGLEWSFIQLGSWTAFLGLSKEYRDDSLFYLTIDGPSTAKRYGSAAIV